MSARPLPRSCDTFVALSPATASGCVVFGKNSDRPSSEVQEVVAFPAKSYEPGSTVKCTYITIPQVTRTFAVVLSKPAWLWGAEMAANSEGLCVGNEAVWTTEGDGPAALLGMDFVRLLAERCATAEAAVDTFAQLLETHGQGGACDEFKAWSYHNSFLIADRKEAWVIETAGKWWVAQHVTKGVRNISNVLSIRTQFDKCHPKLREYCGNVEVLDFKLRFQSPDTLTNERYEKETRESAGLRLLLQAASEDGGVTANKMMSILRDEESGICMCSSDDFSTNGSQVSVLKIGGEDIHWLTATPDPSRSVFKPFRFSSLTANTTRLTQVAPDTRLHPLWRVATCVAKTADVDTDELCLEKLQQLERVYMAKETGGRDDFVLACQTEIEIYHQFSGGKLRPQVAYCPNLYCFDVLIDYHCFTCYP